MDYRNAVVLQGIVRSIKVNAFTVDFTVETVTEFYGGGSSCSQSSFIPIFMWRNTNTDALKEGMSVRVDGKITSTQYTDSEGRDRTALQVKGLAVSFI